MINPKLILAGGLLIVILSLTAWGFAERSGKLSIKAELTVLQTLHEQVVKANRLREIENDERIKTATTERESLVRQLRDNQVRLSTLQRTLATSGSGGVCYDPDGLNSAYGILVSEIRAISGEGEIKAIDLKAAIQAWPK